MARRPFRGLRHRPPRQRYDVVVVGAGVGGLICATLLAREGLRVLLTERHYMVGGYCSTFRRGGFTFDASTHFYPLLGNPGTMPGRLLADLGVGTGWIKMEPVDAFHFPDGSRFEVPADLPSYRARVAERFPDEVDSLDAFFREVRQAYLLGVLYHFKGRAAPQLDQYRDLTVRQVLDRHVRDPRLKLLLTADAAHWGSPPCRTSFVFDSMLRLSYFLGNYYPVGGSQAFADELARRFEELGGDILMSARVDRIQVREGAAVGIEAEVLRGPLRGPWVIGAGAVVSNADARLTFEQLLGVGSVDPELLERVRTLRPSHPCYLTHIGLRGVSSRVLAAAQGYYWRSWDADSLARGGLRCKIFSPTLYEPRMAPPGKQIVILQKVMAVDPEAIGDWAGHKREVEAYLLGELEAAVPGIGEAIEIRLTASARTAERFTGNCGGAMLGWEMSPEQLGEARPGIEGPLESLFMVGHWVRPGGGIAPVIVSALRAAEAITGRELITWRPPPLAELGAADGSLAGAALAIGAMP